MAENPDVEKRMGLACQFTIRRFCGGVKDTCAPEISYAPISYLVPDGLATPSRSLGTAASVAPASLAGLVLLK